MVEYLTRGAALALGAWLAACGPQLAFTEDGRTQQQVAPPTTTGSPPPVPVRDPNDANNNIDPNGTGVTSTLTELLLKCHPAAGNSVGVGAPCPNGGSQCGGSAPFCTGDYPSFRGIGSPICSTFCESPDACGGSDGRCVQDPNNRYVFVCVPSSCIPDSFALPAPTPLKNCLPNGGRGNSVGIGKACQSFNDCNFLAGQACTSSVTNAPVAFCSRTCRQNSDCYAQGAVADAVCIVNPLSSSGTKGCVPLSCTP